MSRRELGWTLVGVQAVLLVVLVVMPHGSPSGWSLVVGGTLAVAGVVLGVAALAGLGSALTPTPVPIEGSRLRTTGAYRFVRHPIYSAVLLMAGGFAVAVGTGWTLLALLALGVFFVGKSRWEDRLLREQHGRDWDAWARRTGGLVPRPRAHRER